jgi:hypothetical protein
MINIARLSNKYIVAVLIVLLYGCNVSGLQTDENEFVAYLSPKDQASRYKDFFGKIKLAIDKNMLSEPMYLERLFGLEIRGARPRSQPTEPSEFPLRSIAYYEPDVAPNAPVFRYRSRRVIFTDLNIGACIQFEFIESIFGAGFKPPQYGQPHRNQSPNLIPINSTGTYANQIGIFKEMIENPVTQISLGFDAKGCTETLIIRQALN